jgi:hypothetical protein
MAIRDCPVASGHCGRWERTPNCDRVQSTHNDPASTGLMSTSSTLLSRGQMPVVIYILPFIGKRPIDKIVAPELVAMVKEIEQRDALEIAKRTPQTSGQIFRYAIAHGFATRNPDRNRCKQKG